MGQQPGEEKDRPLFFLAGPHGSGKSALGSEACERLGWSFLDLPDSTGEEELKEAIDGRAADIITLPWKLLQSRRVLRMVRKAGIVVGLWAHPMEMQVRSGRSEPVCTPVKRLKTRGGFGREGTRCREFKILDRNFQNILMLVRTPMEEAIEDLVDFLGELVEDLSLPPEEREGITSWIESWHRDQDASKKAAKILVNAMARYTLQLREEGASPRTLSGVYSDLQAAGHLVFKYEAPRGKKVLQCFEYDAPWDYEFERQFSDSPALVKRYRKNLEGFGKFLKSSGLI